MLDFISLCDGYKLDHRRQYPSGTEYVYSNFTPRSSRVDGQKDVVFFGLQYFLQRYLMAEANATFFNQPRAKVLAKYQSMLDSYLGPNSVGTEHIGALHDYGRIPLEFKALPEGTLVPLRVPMLTLQNTHPDFFWVVNYIETLMSSVLWQACTSATTASAYRKLLDHWARVSGGPPGFVDWQAHDFSFRGLAGPDAAALSGAAHLLSFTGTDSVPALQLLQEYYDAEGLIGGSVPATEHSVMCAGGENDELKTFARLLDLYPTGVLSVVSDTWDLWEVVGSYLPALKNRIMAREGKLVIRPDSGDPADILCGDPKAADPLAKKGLIECLWDIFGGTVNEAGFRELDSHVGAIYGDSITLARAEEICSRLLARGLASTNVVLGVGSFTYQHVTRDTYGFAIKATWAKVNGEERLLFKKPKTDNGDKNSARGKMIVSRDDFGKLRLGDCLTEKEYKQLQSINLMRPVWREGEFLSRQTLSDVRKVVHSG